MGDIENNITCKYCGVSGVVKYGTYNGVQRYWCKNCKQKFKGDGHLFYSQVPPFHIARAKELRGLSILKIVQTLETELGHRYSKSTIFYWLHNQRKYNII